MPLKILSKLKLFLPGIFLLGFNIGTGSVTAMAKAGATYGMSLLWTILLSCLVTYYMIVTYGRYTLVTGETALYAFKKHIHPAVGLFFIIALTTAVSASVIGVMGIVTDICYVWSKSFIEGGIAPIYWASFYIVLVYMIFLNGKGDFFQKALAVIVTVMAGAFIINFFIMAPPPLEIVQGLIPRMPNVSAGSKGPFLVVASMVGTTVFSGLFIIRTTLVKEAGWTIKDLPAQRKDAFVSVLLMFIISATIMAAAAGTLFVQHLGLDQASQMVELLEPLAGKFAVGIFVAGIVAAGVSSQFPNVLLLPWLLCDYNQTERNMRLTKYRVIALLVSLFGLIVPIFNAKPVVVMIASQVFSALILPITVLCILYLGMKKEIMKEYTHKYYDNIILVLILIFSLYMSGVGFKGLIENFF